MKPVIIGTAGHIDHGKSSLVRALTGTDPDRLKEEKERGITIDLGYAFLSEHIAFIDVPGHERFIKNMVAGVTTVDIALLVVAADDGIMPQTREHFDILRLLDIELGAVAITKIDMADPEWVDLVEQDVRALVRGSFLEGQPVLRVDSLSLRGIDEVRATLFHLASQRKERVPGAVMRLPVDRSFSVKGFGTVVTGSILSGSVSLDDRLELLPKGLEVRVRGIESQGRALASASAGMRVALNLPQISVSEVERGDVLASPLSLRPSTLIDAELRLLSSSPTPLEQRQRVRLHIGTKELLARAAILDRDRVEPGQEALVQWVLEEPYAGGRLDRYVIRRYSPQLAIGGGRILDPNPVRHRKRHAETATSSLRRLADSRTEGLLLQLIAKAKTANRQTLLAQLGLPEAEVDAALSNLQASGQSLSLEARGERLWLARQTYLDFESALIATLRAFHEKNPLRGGMKRAEALGKLRVGLHESIARKLLELAMTSRSVRPVGGELVAAIDFEVSLTKKQKSALDTIRKALRDGRFQPPDIIGLAAAVSLDEKSARDLLQVLVDQGEAINLEGKIYFDASIVAQGVDMLRAAFAEKPELSMSDFRQLVDTSRKYSVPLLNYFDSEGYTMRREDVRLPGPRLAHQG
ncbi:MAG: selenocysteine-specific translation elongation factor [Myxococcota bacterium]|jgi:selenocysteine-specific elongation factor|nr:selenocysteine-specific translation elongation factor [Myxococcota bacterium]